MEVYIYGDHSENELHLPLSSAIIIYLANYCNAGSTNICIHIVTNVDTEQSIAKLPLSSISCLSCSFITKAEVPDTVTQCVFPVIQVSTAAT